MKVDRTKAMAAARAALNEITANFPEDEVLLRLPEAVETYLAEANVDVMYDVVELEEMVEEGDLAPEVVAVLADGARVVVDVAAGKIVVEEGDDE